jgi:hypothetical protein
MWVRGKWGLTPNQASGHFGAWKVKGEMPKNEGEEAQNRGKNWWAVQDLNLRPLAREASALPLS